MANLFLVNFNSYSGYDTDDCSAYHRMANSVQMYGAGLKSDFTGHDIFFQNDLSIFGRGGDQYQALVPGYFNYMAGCTLLAANDGEQLIHEVCPNASDWPKIIGTSVLSPTGNVTVCGVPIAEWQARIPGVLANVSAAPIPASLSASAIVQMARDTLAGKAAARS